MYSVLSVLWTCICWFWRPWVFTLCMSTNGLIVCAYHVEDAMIFGGRICEDIAYKLYLCATLITSGMCIYVYFMFIWCLFYFWVRAPCAAHSCFRFCSSDFWLLTSTLSLSLLLFLFLFGFLLLFLCVLLCFLVSIIFLLVLYNRTIPRYPSSGLAGLYFKPYLTKSSHFPLLLPCSSSLLWSQMSINSLSPKSKHHLHHKC